MPPGLSEWKYRVVPSRDSAGPPSLSMVLITDPRFTGMDHGSSVSFRVATQRSCLPNPLGLSSQGRCHEPKINSNPSRRMVDRESRVHVCSKQLILGTKTAGPK